MAARDAALEFARFSGMQPLGAYPIHIVVKNGRTMLLGTVDNEAEQDGRWRPGSGSEQSA